MLDTLAHAADPYPTYAELRDKGVHRHDDGRWIVARAADVAAVLASPAAVVGVAASDPVQATMARFSDGADHDRRRALAAERLAAIDPAGLRATARELTQRRVEGEVMTLARDAPVGALASALGATDLNTAFDATRQLALALAPPIGASGGDLAGPAGRLAGVLGLDLDEVGINVLALLFQAIDATAGLIGNALVARSRGGPLEVDELVAHTVRVDPPVQLTTRVARDPVTLGDVTIPPGGRIVVLLAADGSSTFGSGLRPCPGEAHALALAAGVLDGLGPAVVSTTVAYEPRPNLRIPAELAIMS